MTHPTDSYKRGGIPGTPITSWSSGGAELHLLKFPPTLSRCTTFVIIGRSSPDQDYTPYKKPHDSFITTFEIFNKLTNQAESVYADEAK